MIFFRMKRKEDQARLLEFERCKIQLQALNEHKQKMTDLLSDTQRQLAEAKRVSDAWFRVS